MDHQFQKAGFDKQRLFYTQGDYGLFQCAKPCHQKNYDNEETVRKMIAAQVETRCTTSLLFLDLGSGGNTPIVFKIPFIRWTMQNPNAVYATVNLGEAFTVDQIKDRSIVIDADIADVLNQLAVSS